MVEKFRAPVPEFTVGTLATMCYGLFFITEQLEQQHAFCTSHTHKYSITILFFYEDGHYGIDSVYDFCIPVNSNKTISKYN